MPFVSVDPEQLAEFNALAQIDFLDAIPYVAKP